MQPSPMMEESTRTKLLEEAQRLMSRYKEQKALLEWAEDDFEISLIEDELSRLRQSIKQINETIGSLSDQT